MIRQRVVLVTGAGCSVPYGFPSGAALVERVTSETGANGNGLFRILIDCGNRDELVRDFHHALVQSRPLSIDRFLAARREFATVGKQAIAALLMPCEQPHRLRPPKVGVDWLHYLQSNILANGRTIDDVETNEVSFVTFNFDRIIEFSLHQWLTGSLGISDERAAEAVRKFGVVHVNGQLGGCSWLGDGDGRSFQPDRGAATVSSVAERLNIIGDAIADEPIAAVRTLFGQAHHICFLGFSYQNDNMAWLDSCGLGREGLQRSGTRLGLTDAEATPALLRKVKFIEYPGEAHHDALAFLRHQPVFHEPPRLLSEGA